jgi:hypothetical protein
VVVVTARLFLRMALVLDLQSCCMYVLACGR